MAYVVSISIHGLAGRREPVQLDFDRHTNIIWGLNGSGKTTLLKILHSAMSNDAQSLERLPFTRALVVLYSENIDTFLTRTIDMTETPKGKRRTTAERSAGARRIASDTQTRAASSAEFQWITDYQAPPARPVYALYHSYLSINRLIEEGSSIGYGYASSQYRERINESALDDMFARQVMYRWQTYHSESLSRVRDIQQQGLGQVLSVLFGGAKSAEPSRVTLQDADEAYEMTRNFLRSQAMRVNFNRESFAERLRHGSELQEIVGHIRTVMRDIADAQRPQQAFQELIRSLYSENKSVTFDARGISVSVGGTEIPLPALSSGERQLLQILLVSLSGGSSSVIIDEPELSLHVDWQERLVESMRILNSDCQLILATHSPEVMAHVGDEFIKQI